MNWHMDANPMMDKTVVNLINIMITQTTDKTSLKTMRNSTRKSAHKLNTWIAALLAMTMLAVSAPSMAGPGDEPSASEMIGDLIVARPVGLAITAIGAAAFVVSLPFSAIGGNVDGAAKTLVVGPARETFVRCLGCDSVGRYRKPKK